MKTSALINEIATALCKAQSEMGGAKKGADNPFFRSKYSDLSMVMEAISKPFADNGLSFVQAAEMHDMKVSVTTRIMHKTGQYIESVTELPPTKNDAQGIGSSISYAKRYGLQSLAGVPSVDDDANMATNMASSRKIVISESENKAVESIQALSVKGDTDGMLAIYNNLPQNETRNVWASLGAKVQSQLSEALL